VLLASVTEQPELIFRKVNADNGVEKIRQLVRSKAQAFPASKSKTFNLRKPDM
jgi:hypothetical protein